jgi:dTDP-4-dehydrorhamnose 3,5-epimerase
MSSFTVEPLALAGALLIKPRIFSDNRGEFFEAFRLDIFKNIGVPAEFVQDNQSLSRSVGTIRGLHFQLPPAPQAKLVRVAHGAIFDVAVDLRHGSATFGKWCGATLTAGEGAMLFLPHGFAHGFCTLEPDTVVTYKVDGYYSAAHDAGIRWDDPDIAIDWPVAADRVVLSQKDAALPPLSKFTTPF